MTRNVNPIGRILVGFIAAWFLAFRVIAEPVILSPDAPNQLALCAGGQIIHVSLDDGTPISDEHGIVAEACPFVGVTAGVLSAEIIPTSVFSERHVTQAWQTGPLLDEKIATLAALPRAPPSRPVI